MKKLFLFSLVLLGFTAGAFAQVPATADASATIVTALTVTKVNNMNFGNIYNDATGGTVILDPDGSVGVGTGAITLTGATTAASFTATGTPDVNVVITLPSGAIQITDGTNNMNVDTWTCSLGAAAPYIGTLATVGGTLPFSVGATLHVVGGFPAGLYTLANGVSVTVNYE